MRVCFDISLGRKPRFLREKEREIRRKRKRFLAYYKEDREGWRLFIDIFKGWGQVNEIEEKLEKEKEENDGVWKGLMREEINILG